MKPWSEIDRIMRAFASYQTVQGASAQQTILYDSQESLERLIAMSRAHFGSSGGPGGQYDERKKIWTFAGGGVFAFVDGDQNEPSESQPETDVSQNETIELGSVGKASTPKEPRKLKSKK